MSTELESARWPSRLRGLCQELQSSLDPPSQHQVRNEIWTILSHSLQRLLETQRSSWTGLTQEDIEDLASEKSLDLLQRLESGRWELRDRTGPEIAGFLATTARNAAVDLLRRPSRQRRVEETALDGLIDSHEANLPRWESPDESLERGEFIAALRECAEQLQPRVRRIWFFRVFYGLATKEIAAHPEVGLEPARIDEVLFNVRQAVRCCMESKGQRLRQLPAGTFFQIWMSFRGVQLEEVGTNGQCHATS